MMPHANILFLSSKISYDALRQKHRKNISPVLKDLKWDRKSTTIYREMRGVQGLSKDIQFPFLQMCAEKGIERVIYVVEVSGSDSIDIWMRREYIYKEWSNSLINYYNDPPILIGEDNIEVFGELRSYQESNMKTLEHLLVYRQVLRCFLDRNRDYQSYFSPLVGQVVAWKILTTQRLREGFLAPRNADSSIVKDFFFSELASSHLTVAPLSFETPRGDIFRLSQNTLRAHPNHIIHTLIF